MWRFSRDEARLEELVQDVFVEAYFSLGRFRGEAPFLHWLRKIATRVGYRYWKESRGRRGDHHVSLDDVSATLAAPEEADAAKAGEMVHALLKQLSPRDRLVLSLIYLEALSVREAARLLGWTETMVKVQAFRARKKLKRLIETAEKEGSR